MRLGQLLIDAKLLKPSELDAALLEQRKTGGKLGEVLVRLRFVTEEAVSAVLASQQGLDHADLGSISDIRQDVLDRLSPRDAHQLKALPLDTMEGGRMLVVAVADVPKGARLEALRELAGAWIVPRLVPRTALLKALELFYGPPPSSESNPSLQPVATTEVRALVDLLVERGVITLEDFLARLRR